MGDDSNGVITLGIGIIIGALFAYFIMKTRVQQQTTTAPATPTMQVMYIPYVPPAPAVQTAAAAPAQEKAAVQVQAAEPVPPEIPAAKDEKTLEIAKDNKGKLSLTRKVLVRAG